LLSPGAQAPHLVGLLCAAAATILLIAPSANHRILFRAREKAELLKLANVLTIAGLAFLAAAGRLRGGLVPEGEL
jgi:O-antigen/teichoic acid export membrane protein